MFERASVCVPLAVMLAAGLPLAAQSDNFAERERALARDLAEQQEARDALARNLEEHQRELEAHQRELEAQQQEQERTFAREMEQRQREFQAQQRQMAEQQALQREYLQMSAIYAADHPDLQRKRRELEALSERLGVPAFDRAMLESVLQTREAQLSAARQKYSSDHPDVVRLERAVEAAKQALASAPRTPPRAEQQRSFARDFAEQQRAFAEQQREYQQSSVRAQRELASELARAKSQLAVSAAEIARLSAQLSQPAMADVQRLRVLGQRGVLGIGVDDTDVGVRVESVTPNGPAAAAGVAVGDTIVAIDGFELGPEANPRVDSPSAAFLAQVAEVEPGEEVELRIVRNGDARDVVVVSTENSSGFWQFWEPQRLQQGPQGLQGQQGLQGLRVAPGSQGRQGSPRVTVLPNGPENIFMMFQRPWSDIELVTLTPALGEYFATDAGLLVVRAGRMGEFGLRDGDVILDIGGREPQTPEHAMRILSSFEREEPIPMSIMRQQRRETLRITVPEETVGWYTGNSGDIWVTDAFRPQRADRD